MRCVQCYIFFSSLLASASPYCISWFSGVPVGFLVPWRRRRRRRSGGGVRLSYGHGQPRCGSLFVCGVCAVPCRDVHWRGGSARVFGVPPLSLLLGRDGGGAPDVPGTHDQCERSEQRHGVHVPGWLRVHLHAAGDAAPGAQHDPVSASPAERPRRRHDATGWGAAGHGAVWCARCEQQFSGLCVFCTIKVYFFSLQMMGNDRDPRAASSSALPTATATAACQAEEEGGAVGGGGRGGCSR